MSLIDVPGLTPPVPAQRAAGGTPPEPDQRVPVSRDRLALCHESATFWSDALPRYACHQQTKADRWAIAAGVVAAVASLSVWPAVEKEGPLGPVAVSAIAILSAVFALVPRVKNYGEMAGMARELTAAYGPLCGELMDALAQMDAGRGTDEARQRLVDRFQEAKAKKDRLRYLPLRDAETTWRDRLARRVRGG
jgi:hypothetical protein